MKKLLITLSALLVISCNNNTSHDSEETATPKALDDKNYSYEKLSKRGYDDLVEDLYTELLHKDVQLKELEDKIMELNKYKDDSTKLFDKYDSKNQSYYNSSNIHINGIKDSILKNKMKLLVSNSFTKYDSHITKHKELLRIINNKQTTISDLHTALKIIKTLPLIEKYQAENLPNTKAIEGYIKKQDQTLKLADTLIKK